MQILFQFCLKYLKYISRTQPFVFVMKKTSFFKSDLNSLKKQYSFESPYFVSVDKIKI